MTARNGRAIPSDARPVNLALQGGGAHGAFTWGVLDRLLEDQRVVLEAVSGTSAGAMNAVVMVDGLMRGGTEGARQKLREFWEAVGEASRFNLLQRGPLSVLTQNWSLDLSLGYYLFDTITRSLSPYEFNPLNLNPLKDILERTVDFDLVRSCDKLKLFISATNVETGRVRVFGGDTLTADMVMASAALPILFQAVEIDGKHYWDGGYMGNPVLFPLTHVKSSRDILIVQINPIEREGVPRTAHEILNRINEISFNASLLHELRAFDLVRRMLTAHHLKADDHREVFIHIIDGQEALAGLGASSKFNPERAFLEHLFEVGRKAATDWLDAHYESLGHESSVDIRHLFHGDGYDLEVEAVATPRPAARRFLSRAARYALKALPRP
jgi:NTE family protein